jgi:hypothetical protein
MSNKFSKLVALAGKATNKASTLSYKATDGGSVSLKLDGMPARFDADGFEALASEKGGRVVVKVPVGEATGSGNGVLGGTSAAEMVRGLVSSETDDTPARKPAGRKPSANGTPAPEPVGAN